MAESQLITDQKWQKIPLSATVHLHLVDQTQNWKKHAELRRFHSERSVNLGKMEVVCQTNYSQIVNICLKNYSLFLGKYPIKFAAERFWSNCSSSVQELQLHLVLKFKIGTIMSNNENEVIIYKSVFKRRKLFI